MRRTARILGDRLGVVTHAARPAVVECGPEWYDRAFRDMEAYHTHYTRSPYYFLWTVIVDRVRRAGIRRVLEIGCGPGQLAMFLMDQGVESYVGLDFSPRAIAMARANVPLGRFVVADARTSGIYAEADYDAIICTEVLEHIRDDLAVMVRFGPSKRCLCTVPNFPYESHVRHFADADAVMSRYGPFFRDPDVAVFLNPVDADAKYFLLDGVRNDRVVV